jgi:hypothetical protein
MFEIEKNKLIKKGLVLKNNEELALRLLVTNNQPFIWTPQVQINSFVHLPLIQEYSQIVLTRASKVHFLTRYVHSSMRI